MSKPIDIAQIAASLTGGPPLAFKQKADGSLVVVAHNGQKFHFTAEQVQDQCRETDAPAKAHTSKPRSSRPTQTKQAASKLPADPEQPAKSPARRPAKGS